MKKAIVRQLFLLTAVLFLECGASLAQAVRTFTLENGFTLFVQEDHSAALVRTELAVRAGFSAQSPSTAGFFPLYTKLLFSDSDITSSCNADSATFVTTSAPSVLPHVLSQIAVALKTPSFPDSTLKPAYIDMKKEVLAYASSTTGFINSAIDARLFSEAPWKQDSGIYPALFTKHTIAEVRTILTSIGSSYYTPQNSALFICGDISAQEVYDYTERLFASWHPGRGVIPNTATVMEPHDAKRFFVLTDPSFSADFTQIIIQYTSLSASQADITAAAFNGIESPYDELILGEPSLAVRSSDYMTAASAQKNGSSRLILQALMEKPYSLKTASPAPSADEIKKCTIASQATLFLERTVQASALSRSMFIAAQNQIASKYESQMGSSFTSLSLLADYWALDTPSLATNNSSDFYTRFLDRVHRAQNDREQQIADAVRSETPYVFLLVNSAVYESQKQSFKDAGYEQITNKNASWYQNELVRKNAFAAEDKDAQSPDNTDTSFVSRAQTFYDVNEPQCTTTVLANNIPVIVKQNPGSQTALISIAIAGGETTSPRDQRFLRTVLINAFASNMQREIFVLRKNNRFAGATELNAWTEETVSYITINCIKDDIKQVLLAASNAILFGDIPPLVADNLVSEQKNQWSIKSASLTYQMTCVALGTLYSGTSFDTLFDADSSILKETSYSSISRAYTELLDASLYTIVISGDADTATASLYAAQTFGLLKQQTERKPHEAPAPAFTKMTRSVLLRHLYTTDVSAADAGEMPEVLVPTTDFYDPVQFWLESPQESDKRALFNALLYELQARIQKELTGNMLCSIQTATPILRAGCVQGEKILHTAAFLSAYKKSVRSLLADLLKDDGTLLLQIKARWIEQNLYQTQSNEGTAALIQKGLLEDNPLMYLESYCAVDRAQRDDVYGIAKTYILEDPLFKLYSADAKK